MTDIQTVEKAVVCVHLDVTIPQGKSRTLATDLGLKKAPPAHIFDLGQKRIFPHELIKKPEAARKAAQRACLKKGVRFMGGYAIPVEKIDDCLKDVQEAVETFDEGVGEFLDNYEAACDEWIESAEEWGNTIRADLNTRNQMAGRFSFKVSAFKLQGYESANGLGGAPTDELTGTLYAEIAQEAKTLWDKTLAGKSKVKQTIRKSFENMKDKLDGLSWLDAGIDTVIAQIDSTLSAAPLTGPIEGSPLAALQGLCRMMSDPEALKDFAGKAADDDSDEDQTTLELPPSEPSEEEATEEASEVHAEPIAQVANSDVVVDAVATEEVSDEDTGAVAIEEEAVVSESGFFESSDDEDEDWAPTPIGEDEGLPGFFQS